MVAGMNTELLRTRRSAIETFLRRFSGEKILFYQQPGNAGDSLIALGTYQAFSRAGVCAETIDLGHRVDGAVVFIAGGGNLVPLYSDTRDAIDHFDGRATELVILPHTIRDQRALIEKIKSRCTIFCRDRSSYEELAGVRSRAAVHMAHDMAFHLDSEKLLTEGQRLPMYRETLVDMLRGYGLTLSELSRRREMNFFRTDSEATFIPADPGLDLSEAFALGLGPKNAQLTAWCFLSVLAACPVVNTDRLHVGIGSVLTGTPCRLYDNSYGKNRAVFDHSLGDFETISFAR
jgi:exopolysaccharide biosynthesis predicted pyruvyltransferase EpsI